MSESSDIYIGTLKIALIMVDYLIFIGVQQIGRSVWTPRLEESNFQQVNRLGVQFAQVEKKLSGLNSALVFYIPTWIPPPFLILRHYLSRLPHNMSVLRAFAAVILRYLLSISSEYLFEPPVST